MRDLTILGLIGYQRVGKDSVARHLVARHGFDKIAFADALKDEVLARFPRTLRAIALEGEDPRDLLDQKPAVVRALLQEYGTEVRRADDPEYWLRAWYTRAKTRHRVVVPDVRFWNEVQFLRESGDDVRIAEVTRPGHTQQGDHASEVSLLPCTMTLDHTLLNDGTLADLHAQVDAMLRGWAWA